MILVQIQAGPQVIQMKCKCWAHGTLTTSPGFEAFQKYLYDGDLEAYRRAPKGSVTEGIEHDVGPRCPLPVRIRQWFSNLV